MHVRFAVPPPPPCASCSLAPGPSHCCLAGGCLCQQKQSTVFPMDYKVRAPPSHMGSVFGVNALCRGLCSGAGEAKRNRSKVCEVQAAPSGRLIFFFCTTLEPQAFSGGLFFRTFSTILGLVILMAFNGQTLSLCCADDGRLCRFGAVSRSHKSLNRWRCRFVSEPNCHQHWTEDWNML